MGSDNISNINLNDIQVTGLLQTESLTPEDIILADESLNFLSIGMHEMSCTIEMASYAFMQLTHALFGIDKMLREQCPNKRVVFLSLHGKTERVRKKNYKRMIKIIEKGD